ncbi:SRPBCC family protein [Streptomyces sp. HUAS 31]|uniref:SRPBCC family protein n=1 Tax=Streptomyces sp. HUAS 31 TaxID=3020055 RepID=UPI002305DDE2|nr:SRPBCC family protein [Streptomyces sp. HUAS 31]WCD94245.1 SRPBCC family protein [Streptomyces sp. HUAS 31]
MAKTDTDEPEAAESGVDRLRAELSDYLGAQLERITEKAGGKLTDITGKLTDVAENGGSLSAIGTRVLQGASPLKAFIGDKANSVKDGTVDKVKQAFGGGGKGKRKSGSDKVTHIFEVQDVGVPLRRAYDHWTQFENFSSFAKGVRDVSKGDEVSSDWKVKVGPSSRAFKATVQEQVPDDRIVWTSEGAKGTTRGVVSFHELTPNLTRIVLVVEYYPSGFFEKTGNLWRAQGRRMRLDFKHFVRFVTLTEEEAEGWRGEIRDGEVVVSHEEALEKEEAEDQESPDEDEPEDEEDGEYEYEDEEDGEYEDEPEAEDDEEQDEEQDEDEVEEEDGESDDEEAPAKRRGTSRRRRG